MQLILDRMYLEMLYFFLYNQFFIWIIANY
jgi:hypothetical protein